MKEVTLYISRRASGGYLITNRAPNIWDKSGTPVEDGKPTLVILLTKSEFEDVFGVWLKHGDPPVKFKVIPSGPTKHLYPKRGKNHPKHRK